MNIELTPEEKDLLTSIVDQYFSSLREEIYKTEEYEFKTRLKEEEAMVKKILEKLGASEIH
ncbi:MAG: hypothetical protein AB1631_06195 [Acidobacteriota bacterium]